MGENVDVVILTPADAREIRRVIRKVDTMRGPGVKNTPDNITLGPVPAPAPAAAPQRPPAALPVGQYQYMALIDVAQNVIGFDWIRGHPLL